MRPITAYVSPNGTSVRNPGTAARSAESVFPLLIGQDQTIPVNLQLDRRFGHRKTGRRLACIQLDVPSTLSSFSSVPVESCTALLGPFGV